MRWILCCVGISLGLGLGACFDPNEGTYSSEDDKYSDNDNGIICPSNASLRADGQCYCDAGYILSEDMASCVLDATRVGSSCTYNPTNAENPTNRCLKA